MIGNKGFLSKGFRAQVSDSYVDFNKINAVGQALDRGALNWFGLLEQKNNNRVTRKLLTSQ